MTVLQLISSEGLYGAESMLIALSQALTRKGHRVVIGVFEDSRTPHTEVAEFAEKLGLTVRRIPCHGRWDFKTVAEIRNLLQSFGAEILHAHGYKADLYGYAASCAYDTVLVSTCHNWPSKRLVMKIYAALDRLVLRAFQRVATPSPLVAGILKQSGICSSKVALIGNGVDIERFGCAVATLTNLGRKVIGFVGRLVPGKGGEVLLAAAQKVVAAHPDASFAFVGEGPLRADWEAMAQSLGIADRVTFTGARNDMPGVYASLNMLVLPSFEEAMPMCVIESMANGKPVIATPVGAIPELILPGTTGLLVEPGDADGLAAAILHLLSNPEKAGQLGENAALHVRRYFSADAMAQKYVELYQQALDTRWTPPLKPVFGSKLIPNERSEMNNFK